jgi:hypothetical protein
MIGLKLLWGLSSLRYFLGMLAVGLAVAFPRYWNHWVYFPAFPNVLDSAVMALIGSYLLYECVREAQMHGARQPAGRDRVL